MKMHWPPGVPPSVPRPQGSLWDALMASVEARPRKPAFVLGDEVLFYAELARRAEALAGWLQRRAGVARGDRVLLWSQNSLEFVVASYAVLRADAVVVPVNAMWTAEEARHVVADSGAKAAVVGAEFVPRLAAALAGGLLRDVVVIGNGAVPDDSRFTPWSAALSADESPAPHLATPDELAVLPYTSGTTGLPKGCMHSHATVQSANLAAAGWRAQASDDVFLAVAPLFHALGMQNGMHLPLMLGATAVLLPRWNRDAALALIERHRVTCWAAPPTMLLDFFSNPALVPDAVRSLKLVTGGSAPMPEALAATMRERFGIAYQEGYGMTETASFLFGNPPHRPKLGSLGVPGPDVDCRIVDPETHRELPAGEVGEIVVCGPQVMLGHWCQPQATADAFIEIEGRRHLRTGDLGRVGEDGYYFMTDRLKRMISVSGYKVWPAEVEAKLNTHPAVHEACVISTPDPRSGEAVKALVVPKPGAALDAPALIAWCRESMAVYKAPRVVDFVAELPKSNTGKVLWRELQERELK
ncbi:AMP-binding protein [Piscinibacter sp.]|uniref:AMP-binding protein n=1 Tax=Piscinibacter sp. TaxID=1903157 RepID=UPI002BF226EC|nr:AMP-binding protein [Albitalea sp.]HUG21013.1 AMP-binding protein [Albitalea sp.]